MGLHLLLFVVSLCRAKTWRRMAPCSPKRLVASSGSTRSFVIGDLLQLLRLEKASCHKQKNKGKEQTHLAIQLSYNVGKAQTTWTMTLRIKLRTKIGRLGQQRVWDNNQA